jgi:hypothetical protein
MATRPDMAKLLHELVVLFYAVLLGRELDKPLAERLVQSRALLPGLIASQFDQVLIGAESYVLHENSVHDIRV